MLQREREQSAMDNIRLQHFNKLLMLPLLACSWSYHSLDPRQHTVHTFAPIEANALPSTSTLACQCDRPWIEFSDLASSESCAGPGRTSVVLASSALVPSRLRLLLAGMYSSGWTAAKGQRSAYATELNLLWDNSLLNSQ